MSKLRITDTFRYHFLQVLHAYYNSYLVIVVCSFLATALHNSSQDVLRMQILLLLPGFYYLVRAKVHHMVPFFLLHFLGFACIFIYYPVRLYTGMALVGIGVAVMIFYSCVLRSEKIHGDITAGMLVVSMLMLLAFYFLADIESIGIGELIQPYMLIVALILMTLFFFNLHMENVSSTLSNVEDMVTSPVQKIRQKNGRFLLIFMVIMGAITVLMFALGTGGLIGKMAGLFNQIFRWFINLFPKGSGEGEQPIYQGDSTGIQDDEAYDGIGSADTALFWKIIQYVLIVVTIAGIIALIIYLLYRFYRWFYSGNTASPVIDEFEESSIFVETEKVRPVKKESFWSRFRWDNRKKVRSIYKKMLIRPMQAKRQVSQSDSPGEILRKLPSEALQGLTPLYEKARYSAEEITKEDLIAAEGWSRKG